ncbi:MAG: Mut7-C RNAse domain-containing protein [Deltaproteobacteria bacterium]|nr:Mut7-C RNAse domain-containing protein [Deltaproteobacteria bacterium]MBW1986292.1 Mut7-C RNAse domain-containing protein [Deltaproteobacteria bacterium]MBW2134333.1 Mut7-C RNAse domain-containing protein [Deltaproteobacteria bacterium]
MRFIVDQTLGGLGKWLRLCGFDTDQKLIRVQDIDSLPSPEQDTYILTRQSALGRGSARNDILVVTADSPEAQLAEVITALRPPPDQFDPLKRCSRCNQLLVPVSREEVRGRVPEHIFQHHYQFFECPGCHRVFWAGSHVAAICRRLQALTDQRPGPKPDSPS